MNIGDRLDRYILESVLGEGGMATVYRARHDRLNSLHALKVLRINVPGVKKRMLREGRVQASLQHPNIVSVTDVIDTEFGLALVMEYVNGPALDEYQDGRPLPIDEAVSIFTDLLHGMGAAHKLRMVHRDLKTANILLHRSNVGTVAKIADFGIVKVFKEGTGNTVTGAMMGTPDYMSPEQVQDAGKVDSRSDMWALGVIFYELLTGDPPFDAPHMLQTYNAIAAGKYKRIDEVRPDVPKHVASLIDGLLTVDVDQRIPDVETALGHLGALLTEVPHDPLLHSPSAFQTLNPMGSHEPNHSLPTMPPIDRQLKTDPTLAPEPAPAELPTKSRRSSSVFIWLAIALAGLVVGGMCAGVVGLWSLQGPAEREVLVSVPSIDGFDVALLSAGERTADGIDFGPQAVAAEISVQYAVGTDCETDTCPGSECQAWCEQGNWRATVSDGTGPLRLDLPIQPPTARSARIVTQPPATLAFVDEVPIELTEGALETTLAPGPHTLRFDIGECTPTAIGCSQTNDCPEGCSSSVETLVVLPKDAPVNRVLGLVSPVVAEPAPVTPPPPKPAPRSSSPASNAAFARFVKRAPEWERSTAIASGRVDAGYLRGWDNGVPSGPATRVTWASAVAFCAGRGGLLSLDAEPKTWSKNSRVKQEWRSNGGKPAWRRNDGETNTRASSNRSFAFTGFRCAK